MLRESNHRRLQGLANRRWRAPCGFRLNGSMALRTPVPRSVRHCVVCEFSLATRTPVSSTICKRMRSTITSSRLRSTSQKGSRPIGWSIFGGRDREHSLLPYLNRFRSSQCTPQVRRGYVRGGRGSAQLRQPEAALLAGRSRDALPGDAAESVLSNFVEQVIDRLACEGVTSSEVALCWSRVSESRADPHERSFCEAAGALGADPYSISDADASFVDAAGELFVGEALTEFLAGVGKEQSVTQCATRRRDDP